MRLEMMGDEKRLAFAKETQVHRSQINDVCIGEGTEIEPGVTFLGKVRIGRNCRIREGTVIGSKGFSWGFDEDGTPTEIVHIGGVTIGDNVEIGALNAIARGTVNDTVIGNFVKTDNLCHIAHNCSIGDNTILTVGVLLSGSVKIGKNCWIGPNTCVKNKLKIGDSVLVGIGSVVINDVEDGTVVAGNPAKFMRRRLEV